jgi:hypothetical protein
VCGYRTHSYKCSGDDITVLPRIFDFKHFMLLILSTEVCKCFSKQCSSSYISFNSVVLVLKEDGGGD